MIVDKAKKTNSKAEKERLKALISYDILDTSPEEEFDSIVELAALSCNASIAVLSFIDSDREWFKAKYGITLSEIPLAQPFCQLNTTGIFEISGTTKAPLLKKHPLVKGGLKLAHYASIPISTPQGHCLGRLCVFDKKPKKLTKSQRKALTILSINISNTLERRLSAKRLTESKLELFKVIESIPLGIYLMNSNKTLLYSNKKAIEILGKPISVDEATENLSEKYQLYKSGTHKLYPVKELPIYLALQGKETFVEDIEIDKGGLRLPIEIWSAPVKDDYNNILYAISVFDDITLKREKQSELYDYKQALDQSAIVAITDEKGIITYANEQFCSISKYKEEELIGQTNAIVNSGHHDKKFMIDLWKTIAKGKIWRGEIKNKAKDGTIYWVKTTIVPFFDMKGKIKQYIAIRFDITDRKLLENELIEAKEIAEKSVLAKDSFLANMSHEIRTPLNAITGFTELLELTNVSQEQSEYIELIQTAGNHLLSIINDILDFAKIESGKLTLEETPFNIEKAIKSAHKILLPSALKKGIKLSLFTDSSITKEVLGDPVRLHQILMNLIGNAIKFTEKGKVELITTLEEETKSTYRINFTVKDTGIGISKEKLTAIFDRFKQAEIYTTRKHGGAGLGLSISKELVGLMGSKLEVESIPGKGSEFSFSLLYKVAPQKKQQKLPPITQITSSSQLHNLKILLVEDNEINQLLIEKILSFENVKLDIANDGLEGIKLVKENKYDIILMDLQMPDLDGYQATEIIRNDLKITTPIIAMTAHSIVGEKEKCLQVGMTDFISKPFKKSDFIGKITLYTNTNDLLSNESNESNSHLSESTLSKIDELGDGDEDFAIKMIGIFLKNGEKYIADINKATANSDKYTVARVAHKLKSNFGVFNLDYGLEITDLLENAENMNFEKVVYFQNKLHEYCASIFKQFSKIYRDKNKARGK